VRKVVPVLGGLAVLLIAGSMGAGAQSGSAGASARAYAIRVALPGQSVNVAGSVEAPPEAVAIGGGFSYPTEGGGVATGGLTASATARVDVSSATSEASSEVQSVSLFGGEVTAARVAAHVRAQATQKGGTGDLSGSVVEGLSVLGQGVDASSPGARIPIADWGYALVLAQGTTPAERAFRGFVTALEIHITADHGGMPAGSVVSVGFAEAAVAAPPPPEKKKTTQPGETTPEPTPAPGAGNQKGTSNAQRGQRLPLPKLPEAKLTPGGYVFPVYGVVSFTDTFGAARADTGWHHGEDIFAPLGAPILAVADGTVFSVGWNDLGGNRLWLRDDHGNEFYYAHLSAFSPLARNGARVRAGDVLGFVGNTGDAEGTPTHLHFEIHPLALLGLGYDGVIAPYPYLLAWRRLEDIRFVPGAAWLPRPGQSTAPEPGAYLLDARDISSLSGLDPGSLRRAFAAAPSAKAP
jgi:murein DD-endopeptidase MepM/ murein hydrolase activator NlpD